MRLKFVVIGNSENRRIQLWQQALKRFNVRSATVVNYLDLICGRENLENLIDSETILRFESPEKKLCR